MKKSIKLTLYCVFFLITQPLLANNDLTESTNSSQPSCMNLSIACERAGLGQNRHQIWRNCIKPVIEGNKKFRRLNIDPEDIQSCRDRIQMHKPYYWRKGANQGHIGS